MCQIHRNALYAALVLTGAIFVAPTFASAQDASADAAAQASAAGEPSAQDAADQKKKAATLSTIKVVSNSVNQLAPSAPPLEAIQPTSVMDTRFIRDSLRMNGSYDDIVKYAPSMSVTSPEGSGLGKNEGVSLRGFQDGQFNVTFDGIPFGNLADLHRSTSAYFSTQVLGQADIERGPGDGATIGNATFGGTIALHTREASDVNGITPYASFGSWGLNSQGVSFDQQIGSGTALFADASRESAETYLKGTDDRRSHFFVKTVTQAGDSTQVTFVANYNRSYQNTVQGQTLAQIEEFGPRFGLGDDPTVQNYKGYNNARYTSNFDYLGIHSLFGDWEVSNKLYYLNFDHWSNKAKDATDLDPDNNGVKYYDSDGHKIKTIDENVPGKQSDSGFYSYGDIFTLQRYFGDSVFKAGVWLQRSKGQQVSYPMDLTLGVRTGSKTGLEFSYLDDLRLDTFQPYVQYDWAINSTFTLGAGARFSRDTRYFDSPYSHESERPLHTKATYDAFLPSLTLHAWLSQNWTAYVQAAEGSLTPPVAVIDIAGNKDLKPEKTMNFQIGTAYATKVLTFGADIYHIRFNNMLTETEVSTDLGNENTYINGGGATYEGIEGEVTVAVTSLLSFYGNASRNRAVYKGSNGVQIAQTPRKTGVLGMIYGDKAGFYATLMGKYTGPQYGVDNTTDDDGNTVFGNAVPLGGYTAWNLSLGYRSETGGFTGKGYAISLNLDNIFDVHKLSEYAGTQKESGDDLFFGLPGRGVFVDFSMKL
jgi:iron complex outermembrane receptor protein